MSTRQLFKNNVSVDLLAGITNVDLTCVTAAGLGTLFGTFAAGEHIEATIKDDTGAYEIVKVTGVAADTLTIVRAQESTTARTFLIGDAPTISIRVTADTLARMAQKDADETIAGSWTFSANPTFAGAGGLLGSIQTFTASGTYTPPAGLKFAIVEVQGAGGGGGAGSTVDGACGGGGGGGGYALEKISAAAIGASKAVTIGAGGTVGATSAGGTGGTTSFGALVSATGGAGGAEGTSASGVAGGGVGGNGSGGNVNIEGGAGAAGSGASSHGGNGGNARFGGAAQGGTSVGVAGGNYGGGGSGGRRTSATNRAGGAGADGFVLVYEYY